MASIHGKLRKNRRVSTFPVETLYLALLEETGTEKKNLIRLGAKQEMARSRAVHEWEGGQQFKFRFWSLPSRWKD